MKKLLALVLAAGSTAGLFAQAGNGIADPGETGLVVGFDFGNVAFEGLMLDGDSGTPLTSLNGLYSDTSSGDHRNATSSAAYSPRGTLYFDGSKGSSVWDTESNFGSSGSIGGVATGGTTINRDISTIERTTVGSINFGGNFESTDNNLSTGTNLNALGLFLSTGVNRVSFAVDTTNFTDISLSLAGMTDNAGSVQWYYSVDGGSTVNLISGASSTLSSSFAAYTYDFSGIAAIENVSEALFIADFSGTGISTIDNLQFLGTASAIPEPSTYAAIAGALALGGVILRRRYAKA